GNELNGVFVLARLANFLRQIEAGEREGVRLLGRVRIVPAVNVLGVNTRSRLWPFDGTDLNRLFPGDAEGEPAQRIADALLRATAPAEWRVDLHSSNADFEELPQVRLYGASEDERRAARFLGLPAVIERPVTPTVSATLAHAWKADGRGALVVQA